MAAKVSIPFLEVPEGFLCSIKVSANTRCKTRRSLQLWSCLLGLVRFGGWAGGRGIGLETEISHYER
jgi:hypothetical protein